jgi:predicted ATPase
LKTYLRDKRLLLLLDNFEQLLEAAPTIAALLGAAPGLKVLITSRAVLHLRGEKEITVPPLNLPDPRQLPALARLTQYAAVALFIERALDVQPDFAVTNENAPAVAEICARLDGLPLAIELAAARSKLFAPAALLSRLEKRLPLLTGGPRDLPARQQTLRNTIDWSYRLLNASEQTLFRRLGVFVGGWTLEAAAVCNAEGDLSLAALDELTALVDQSLLRQEAATDGEPRFVMLELIREYALERLEASGEADVMRRRHAEFFLGWAEQFEGFGPSQRVGGVERFEMDHDNFRAALTWAVAGGSAEVAARLVAALGWFWPNSRYISERQRWLEAALERSSALPAATRAKVLAGVANVLVHGQGDYRRATTLYQASLALWRELGRQEESAERLFDLGKVAVFQSDYAQATARFTESLELFRAQDDKQGIAWTLKELGALANDQGDYPRGKALLEDGLARFRDLGHKQGIADTLHVLGGTARLQGDDARALALGQESLALSRELGFKALIPSVLIGLGYIAQRQGDVARASGCFAEALALRWEMGNLEGVMLCLAGLAGVAGMQEQPVRAARLFGAAEALAELLDTPPTAIHQMEIDRNVAIARAQLDEATFTAAWEAGRAMTLEQAIASALEEDQ